MLAEKNVWVISLGWLSRKWASTYIIISRYNPLQFSPIYLLSPSIHFYILSLSFYKLFLISYVSYSPVDCYRQQMTLVEDHILGQMHCAIHIIHIRPTTHITMIVFLLIRSIGHYSTVHTDLLDLLHSPRSSHENHSNRSIDQQFKIPN